ncbi:MAG: hypothetical protein JNK05_24800 [Myxococcales bacterium]|nr:hypothetical protein [Myxococcales bacterium]
MSDAVILPDWDAQVAAARSALLRAATDEARADAYIRECLVHVEFKRATLGAEAPSVRAAQVARGRLSQEQALRDVLRVSNAANAHFNALVPVLSTELLLRVPRAYWGVNSSSERAMIARLVREGRIGDAFSFVGNGRLDEVPYPSLVANVSEYALAAARRTLDDRIANDVYQPAVVGGEAAYQRLYALQRLVTRTRLAPLGERQAWFERCERAIEANATVVGMFVFGGDVRAQFALALVEAGDAERAMEQLARVAINVVPFRDGEANDGTVGIRAAFDALSRAITAESRVELEASLLRRFDRPDTTTRTWLSLSQMLSGARSEQCVDRVLAIYDRPGGDRMGTWIDDLPRRAFAAKIPAYAKAFDAVIGQHLRNGRTVYEVLHALRAVPADGPHTAAVAARLRAWAEHRTQPLYAHELVLRWLFEAARRGSDEAFAAIVAMTRADMSWHNYDAWFRVLDSNRVDVLLDAHRRSVAPWTLQSWTAPLALLRATDDASLRRFYAPRVLRAARDPLKLALVEQYVRPEDEHALVCLALDAHAETMSSAWALRLVSLANVLENQSLAHKCLARYCANTSRPTWKFDQVASAVVRLTDEARAERSLARGFAGAPIDPWLLPRTKRLAWLASLDRATSAREVAGLWSRVHMASVGLVRDDADREARAALSLACSALVSHRLFDTERRVFSRLVPFMAIADLEALVLALKRTPAEILLWFELSGALAERRSPLAAQAIEVYLACHSNPRDASRAWSEAMLARWSGDRDAIGRAFAAAGTRGLVSNLLSVAAANGWLDEIASGLLSMKNRSDAARCALFECWRVFDEPQRARVRPLLGALLEGPLDSFVLSKLCAIATPDERVAIAKAYGSKPVRSPGSAETPGIHPSLLSSLAGDRGVALIAEQFERELDALL